MPHRCNWLFSKSYSVKDGISCCEDLWAGIYAELSLFCHVSMFEDIYILHFLTFQNVYNTFLLHVSLFPTLRNYDAWNVKIALFTNTLIVIVVQFTFLSNFGTFSSSNLVSWTFPFYKTWWIFHLIFESNWKKDWEKSMY